MKKQKEVTVYSHVDNRPGVFCTEFNEMRQEEYTERTLPADVVERMKRTGKGWDFEYDQPDQSAGFIFQKNGRVRIINL